MDLWSSVLGKRKKPVSDPRVNSLNIKLTKKTILPILRQVLSQHYLEILAVAPIIVLPFLSLSIQVGIYPELRFSIAISSIWYFLLLLTYIGLGIRFGHKIVFKKLRSDKKDIKDTEWYQELVANVQFNARIQRDIAEVVLSKDFAGYDPTETESLAQFRPVQNKTECIFAKTAKLWGSRDWNPKWTLEENVQASIPALIQFLYYGERDQLDGFLFELREPGWLKEEQEQETTTYNRQTELVQFGEKVRRCLKTISDHDPGRVHSMNKPFIGRKGWFFQFARFPIFLTTFAPVYPESHSRYAFDAPRDSCFVLLQPEYSFMFHELDPDTPHTEWENPKTVRDRIRIAYKKAGRAYDIPPTVSYPPAHHIVKPYPVDTGKEEDVVEWWLPHDTQ